MYRNVIAAKIQKILFFKKKKKRAHLLYIMWCDICMYVMYIAKNDGDEVNNIVE